MNQKKYKPETRERRLERLSKFVSLILRHRPEVIGITLDEHGWANVDEFYQSMNGVWLTKEFPPKYLNSNLLN